MLTVVVTSMAAQFLAAFASCIAPSIEWSWLVFEGPSASTISMMRGRPWLRSPWPHRVVERSHRHLRTGFSDGLGRDDAGCFVRVNAGSVESDDGFIDDFLGLWFGEFLARLWQAIVDRPECGW